MISNREDLRMYIKKDMPLFTAMSRRERMICRMTMDPIWQITRYVRFLRYEEYFFNTCRGKLGTIFYLFFLRKKNRLGNRLGFKIPRNCFGPGLMICHHGGIIVNESARIGADCVLHGDNCIGNNGKESGAPQIGDGLDLGIGAKIIGAVKLGNNVRVGANAVVTHSCPDDGVTLLGVPARQKERKS